MKTSNLPIKIRKSKSNFRMSKNLFQTNEHPNSLKEKFNQTAGLVSRNDTTTDPYKSKPRPTSRIKFSKTLKGRKKISLQNFTSQGTVHKKIAARKHTQQQQHQRVTNNKTKNKNNKKTHINKQSSKNAKYKSLQAQNPNTKHKLDGSSQTMSMHKNISQPALLSTLKSNPQPPLKNIRNSKPRNLRQKLKKQKLSATQNPNTSVLSNQSNLRQSNASVTSGYMIKNKNPLFSSSRRLKIKPKVLDSAGHSDYRTQPQSLSNSFFRENFYYYGIC